MQSIFNNGLPLCLTGVTYYHQLTRTKRITDHDRKREEIKRTRPEISRIELREFEGVIRSLDLVVMSLDDDDDQSSIRYVSCAAKAA